MKKILNQRGLTLLELLGGLTLVFILGAGTFGILNNSLHLFNRETTRIDVRGQANTIATQLTTFYQQNGGFKVEALGEGVRIISGDEGEEIREFSLPNHRIRVTRIDPKKPDAIQLEPETWTANAQAEAGGFIKIRIRIGQKNTFEEFELITVVSRLG